MSQSESNTPKPLEDLESMRASLRNIDDEIMHLVMRRMSIVHDIGSLKKRHGMPILDRNREDQNKLRNQQLTSSKLDSRRVDELSELLAAWARDIQSQMR